MTFNLQLKFPRVKDWASKADSHPALPPGRIQKRLQNIENSQNVDSAGNSQNVDSQESHPALPPGRIPKRVPSQHIDSQERVNSQSANLEELQVRLPKVPQPKQSGREGDEKSNTSTAEGKKDSDKKEEKPGNPVGVLKRVDLQHPVFNPVFNPMFNHPVFNQKILQQLRERNEEENLPWVETSIEDRNGVHDDND